MTARSSGGTALITAAAGGVGRAVAMALAPQWAIVLHESPAFAAEAETLAEKLRAAGGRAAVVLADLADVAATGTILERAVAAQGPRTLLVNAATFFDVDHGHFDAASWARLFAVNLRAPWQLGDLFAAALPSDQSGAIVHIVDRRLWGSEPGAPTYELSQAALCAATETMARAYAPRIRVNAVGPTKTVAADFSIGSGRAEMPLTNSSAADSIARAVLYLAGAESATGQMIGIDAGNA